MKIPFRKRLSPDQIQAIIACCGKLNWPDTHIGYLAACIAFETGGTFSPSIRNSAGSGAIGLIQFMPATARALGTSVAELSHLDFIRQMMYVAKYFQPYADRIHNLNDMYLAILMPKHIGASPDTKVFIDPSVAYRQNAGLDANKDGYITVREICSKVQAMHDKGMTES
nr:MAG TPA: tail protein [Caudoviricetes sp.]